MRGRVLDDVGEKVIIWYLSFRFQILETEGRIFECVTGWKAVFRVEGRVLDGLEGRVLDAVGERVADCLWLMSE